MLLSVNYGPFKELVGYVSAIIATVYFIWVLVWGKRIWQTPQEILPSKIRGLISVILGVGIVFIWLFMNPSNLKYSIYIAVIFVIIAVIVFILFFSLIRMLTFDKLVAINSKKTKEIKIIGGLWLKRTAKESKDRNNIRTTQELFNGSAFNVDELWSRLSQELAKSFIIVLYLAIVTFGTLGITTAGFVIQVKLTNKPASEAFIKSDNDKISNPSKNDVNSNSQEIRINKFENNNSPNSSIQIGNNNVINDSTK